MGNIYTISELSIKLSVTRPIVEKKLKQLWGSVPVPYTSITQNNRDIKAIELSEQQEHTLGILNINVTPIDTPIEQPKSNTITEDTLLEVINFTKENNNRIDTYMQRIINAEKQVLLLEDSENRTKSNLLELQAKIKQLQNENKLYSRRN